MDGHQRRGTFNLWRPFQLLGDQRRKWNSFDVDYTRGHGNCGHHGHSRPRVYSPAQSVSGTLSATSSSSDIGVTTPYLWIAQGASLNVPLTARVVNMGTPENGAAVDFFVDQGSGSLSAPSAVTNSNGYASVTLMLTNFTANVQLSAYVAPGNKPCQTIYGNAVAAAMMKLQAVAGAGQVLAGTAFQPLTVRVTDSSTPPNPVLGSSVLFQSTVLRPMGNELILTPGDPTTTQPGTPVILSVNQSAVQSDANGLASFVPSVGSFTGPLEIEIEVSARTTAVLQNELETFPAGSGGNTSPTSSSFWHGSVLARVGRLSKRGREVQPHVIMLVIPSPRGAKTRNLLSAAPCKTAGSSLRPE